MISVARNCMHQFAALSRPITALPKKRPGYAGRPGPFDTTASSQDVGSLILQQGQQTGNLFAHLAAVDDHVDGALGH